MTAGASTSAPSRPVGKDLSNQPWTEKYRPRTLDDVAANKEIIDTIKRLTDENKLPHLLLYGPPGEFPFLTRFCLQDMLSASAYWKVAFMAYWMHRTAVNVHVHVFSNDHTMHRLEM
jgi:hypothetical protein